MSSRSIGSASRLFVAGFITLAALALLTAFGGTAYAKKRVVVLPFIGRGADGVHDEVEEIIQADCTIVSQSAYLRARKKVRGRGEAAIAQIAADLQVDALIEGSLEKRRGGYTLVVTVREGLTGTISDTLAVRMKSTRLDAASRRDLSDKLLPALAKVGELGGGEPIEITPPVKPDDVDTETPLGNEPPVAETPPATDESDHPPNEEMLKFRYNRHAAVDVQIGASAGLRNLRFTFRDTLANNMKPNGYKGSIVPSVMLVGEIYPLAFSGKGDALSGIGVSFVLDRVLLLKSKLGTTEYSTSQTRYGAGLRYRFPFGKKATLPSLKLIAGWNHLDFTIDRGATDLDLPNVKYSYLDFGLGIRFPLGSPGAALYLDARYMQVLSSGEISGKTFYGDGGILGIDGDLGIELIFLKRAIVRVGGRYQRIAYDFDGNGMRSDRDSDGTSDVGGALDQYFQVYATGGYLF